MRKLYLDEAATTSVYPEVVKLMEKFYLKEYGNPSSLHALGERAMKAIIEAKKAIAKEINCSPGEVIFTSGATEANNLAILGLARTNKNKRKIIISAIEHPSINEAVDYKRKEGYEVLNIPVDGSGLILLDELEKAIDDNILLVSIIHGNNIIGTIQDIEKIGQLCRRKKVVFHTDATQTFGKEKIDVKKMNISLLSASAHKIHGPKGIGFLYVRDGVKIEPLIYGGGQEKGIRSGTENVPAIVGFSKALELYRKENKKNRNKIRKMRDSLMIELEKIGGRINGSREKGKRLDNNIHVSFDKDVDNETLVYRLSGKGIYVSAGSACDSKKEKEDHVLKAIGLSDERIRGSIRITIGNDVSEGDVERVVREISRIVRAGF